MGKRQKRPQRTSSFCGAVWCGVGALRATRRVVALSRWIESNESNQRIRSTRPAAPTYQTCRVPKRTKYDRPKKPSPSTSSYQGVDTTLINCRQSTLLSKRRKQASSVHNARPCMNHGPCVDFCYFMLMGLLLHQTASHGGGASTSASAAGLTRTSFPW